MAKTLCGRGLIGLVIAIGGLHAQAWADSYPSLVIGDQPVAFWRFNDVDADKVANQAKSPPSTAPATLLDATPVGDVQLGIAGPRPETFPTFEPENRAASFGGQKDRLTVSDPGDDSVLDFDLEDEITLEAWVDLRQIKRGEQIYVVGKGRTNRKGFAADNQNYALRLRCMPGDDEAVARVSFLFRDAEESEPAASKATDDGRHWHRWTSNAGFLAKTGWRHIAVTYVFGHGDSVRGYIDGVEVKGVWDMGGASDARPVVDNDELWIGSSQGGSSSSTFDGSIDEVAIYRSALSASVVKLHGQRRESKDAPPVAATEPAPSAPREPLMLSKEVKVEILEGMPDDRAWNLSGLTVGTSYTELAFALVDLPKKYSSKGLVTGRAWPIVVRTSANLNFPAGSYRLLLRARGASRLFMDDLLLTKTEFRNRNASGHEAVPDLPTAQEPGLRPLGPGQQEQLVTIKLDGQLHAFRLEVVVGDQKLRPDLGEMCICIAPPGESFRLLSPSESISLTDAEWQRYATVSRNRLKELNAATREAVGREETEYWRTRHELARELWKDKPVPVPPASAHQTSDNPIDRFLFAAIGDERAKSLVPVDDYAFARRVSLDVTGVIPSRQQIAELRADKSKIADKSIDGRAKLIDTLLADPRWADNWVGYWQDVLAENPGILKPELNNTGPFRWWIHESLLDNKPMDRFASELMMMEGSPTSGGPAGFSLAAQNDAPMAEKAHTLGKAFLGIDLKCARCHDAPYHPFKQHDTFSLAAMLDRRTQTLPKTSTVPIAPGARKPLVTISLHPGDKIEPTWTLSTLASARLPAGVLRKEDDTREQLAAIVTSPENERFANVLVNRVWVRYIGWGFVPKVDDWEESKVRYPELVHYLSRELMTHDYDLKHIARLILNSSFYQSAIPTGDAAVKTADEVPWAPVRRRMAAEQVLDSGFAAAEKAFGCEELNFDPEGRRPEKEMLSLGVPARAWQMASLSNERDRPALSLPVAQSLVDVLAIFGWRESRQNPQTLREEAPNALQPLVLANGVVGNRIVGLSDDHAVTRLCLEQRPLGELVDEVFLQILSRPPAEDERKLFVELLTEGYDKRCVATVAAKGPAVDDRRNAVSWSNHLSPEASRIKLELERKMRAGDPPTDRLTADWRERMEDMLWSLVNSPEFIFIP